MLETPALYNFRHYNREGRLLWASGLDASELDVIKHDLIIAGSDLEAEVKRAQEGIHNTLVDTGEQAMLDVFFRGGTAPTFYFGLTNSTALAETDTMTQVGANEITGSGYARISVARNSTDWPTLALDAGDYRVDSVTKTFTATGTWTAASNLVLVSTASGSTGTFYAWVALSQARTLGNGDSLQVSMRVKAQ